MSASPDVSRSTRIVASDDCLSTTIDDESVILHLERGTYYGFNEVGTEIWEFAQEPRTVDEICQMVQDSYDVDGERCLADVRELVSELLEVDLVTTVDE
jgi:hypothetical protein